MRIASSTTYPMLLGALLLIVLALSGIAPHERLTWVMETAPVMMILPILVLTYRRFL